MRTHITFLLNGVEQRVGGISPTTTLLQWLRREKRLTGTKEGCAEGDCGACTVSVARRDGRGVRHTAINACITLLPMLEGAAVTTVEGVAGADGALHPCQQAMIECHGSQCGFCTPGFVMSLYTMYRATDVAPSVDEIDMALAGNLCRCTGYSPIVAAARRMFEIAAQSREEALIDILDAMQHRESLCVDGDGRRMFVPLTADELATLYAAHPEATLIAGATDVGLWVTKQARPLPVTILVDRVCDLGASVAMSPGREFIAANISHAKAAVMFQDRAPALAELWRRFAGMQVRNSGTVGGNIGNGSPIGDLPPVLIAIGATLHLRRGDERRALPLEDYFIAYGKQDRRPGEFITGVEIPTADIDWRDVAVHKVSKRFDDDISAVCGAFHIVVRDGLVARARIAFGGMAEIPKRALEVEAALLGRSWTGATIDAALPAFAKDFSPINDARASAAYRLEVAKNLLLRTFLERGASAAPTRLVGAGALAAG